MCALHQTVWLQPDLTAHSRELVLCKSTFELVHVSSCSTKNCWLVHLQDILGIVCVATAQSFCGCYDNHVLYVTFWFLSAAIDIVPRKWCDLRWRWSCLCHHGPPQKFNLMVHLQFSPPASNISWAVSTTFAQPMAHCAKNHEHLRLVPTGRS